MTNLSVTVQDMEDQEYRRSFKDSAGYATLRRFCRNRLTIFGAVIIVILILMAIFAPYLSPYSYSTPDPLNAYETPNLTHWFGTDKLGRDIFTRICYGARYSLSLGVFAELAGLAVGIVLGCLAGYFGGLVDNLILRFCDVLQAIPSILLTIIIAQVLGSGYVPTVIALGITGMPQVVRLLRGQLLSLREEEYIDAAKMVNSASGRIMFKHLLPNAIAPLIINSSMGIGAKIMTSASLSYLGLGIQEPLPEWGAMLAAGKEYFRYYPHLVLIPGLFIAITVLAFNLVGDGLRDALDTKQRK
ncbi:MAG: ABC transporter permease [Lachnospiraceae bacterium]|nr:ABC transporter permease [Lachnospiraceae bacterium]